MIVPTRLIQLLADSDTGRSRRTMQAMLKMTKLNVDELERAAGVPRRFPDLPYPQDR